MPTPLDEQSVRSRALAGFRRRWQGARRVGKPWMAEEGGCREHLATMATDNRQLAKFNKLGLGQLDEPLAEGLHLVWASGARVTRLTPR